MRTDEIVYHLDTVECALKPILGLHQRMHWMPHEYNGSQELEVNGLTDVLTKQFRRGLRVFCELHKK